MAPEQFQGENSSASDLYALGLIACEILSGKPDLYGLEAPRKVREQIHRALAYRPEDRPENASEFCNQLADALSSKTEEETPSRVVVLSRARLAWLDVTILLASLAAFALLYLPERSFETRSVNLSLVPPKGTAFGGFAVSHDGRRVAVIGADSTGNTQLWVRSLGSPTYQLLARGVRHHHWLICYC